MNKVLKNLSYSLHYAEMKVSFGLEPPPSENISDINQGDMVDKFWSIDFIETGFRILICSYTDTQIGHSSFILNFQECFKEIAKPP